MAVINVIKSKYSGRGFGQSMDKREIGTFHTVNCSGEGSCTVAQISMCYRGNVPPNEPALVNSCYKYEPVTTGNLSPKTCCKVCQQ